MIHGSVSVDVHDFPISPGSGKFNNTIGGREQTVIASSFNIIAGMKFGAALFDNDTAGQNRLTVGNFYAQPFGIGISSVTGTSLTFFMCHDYLPSSTVVFLALATGAVPMD